MDGPDAAAEQLWSIARLYFKEYGPGPDRRDWVRIRKAPAPDAPPLSLAGILAALCSFAVGVATSLKGPADAGINPESMRVMLLGLSESFIPLFVAFAFLAVAWLLVAAGLGWQP